MPFIKLCGVCVLESKANIGTSQAGEIAEFDRVNPLSEFESLGRGNFTGYDFSAKEKDGAGPKDESVLNDELSFDHMRLSDSSIFMSDETMSHGVLSVGCLTPFGSAARPSGRGCVSSGCPHQSAGTSA
jgi:hypothetical protein